MCRRCYVSLLCRGCLVDLDAAMRVILIIDCRHSRSTFFPPCFVDLFAEVTKPAEVGHELLSQAKQGRNFSKKKKRHAAQIAAR